MQQAAYSLLLIQERILHRNSRSSACPKKTIKQNSNSLPKGQYYSESWEYLKQMVSMMHVPQDDVRTVLLSFLTHNIAYSIRCNGKKKKKNLLTSLLHILCFPSYTQISFLSILRFQKIQNSSELKHKKSFKILTRNVYISQ